MKEPKLFKMAKYIDEELISEAAEYMPSQNTQKQDEGEAVYISAVRTKGGHRQQIWKYSAAAAVLLAAAGVTVFVFNYGGGLGNTFDFPYQLNSSGEQTAPADETSKTELITEISDTEKPAEEVKTMTPLKIECLPGVNDYRNFNFPVVVYVDSDPEIPYKSLDDEYFTEMTTEELIDYYDCYRYLTLKDQIESGHLIEVTDENTRHGIYNLPDGSIYDLNTFTFELAENTTQAANRFTVTIGKWTRFGQEYIDFFREHTNGELSINGGKATLYNEETNSLFYIARILGVSFMFSGTVDEITHSFYAGDPKTTEYGYYYTSDNSRALVCSDMLVSTFLYMIDYSQDPTLSFNRKYKLWYRIEDNSYLNEETFEWIPAEEWLFE